MLPPPLYITLLYTNNFVQQKCFDLSDLSCGTLVVPELHVGHHCFHVAAFICTLDMQEILQTCFLV